MLRRRFEYESSDSSREEMKRKFAHTMEFVEEYLRDVVSQPYPFGDKDKNELTLEVKIHWTCLPSARLLVSTHSSLMAFHTLPLSQVVNLARNLVYFGFYSFSELLRLTRTLLAILDIVQHPLTFMHKLNKSPEAGQCSASVVVMIIIMIITISAKLYCLSLVMFRIQQTLFQANFHNYNFFVLIFKRLTDNGMHNIFTPFYFSGTVMH